MIFLKFMELTHNNYVIIKRFSKVDIKQNNISNVILLIKFLVYQWDPSLLQGCHVVYIIVNIMKFVFYLLSNHIFVCFNQKDAFLSDNKWFAQRMIEFTDRKLKPKVHEDGFIYIIKKSMRPHFNSVFDLQINNSETYLF